jgi:4-amino-4-deoxy-L-arabinose transferase-like glycosyltransferase
VNQLRFFRAEPSRRVELALLVAILLVAAFFRFHRPDSVPPGPSHDELRMMDLGELIVEGERPIHWTISYSAEPLFMYLLALAMPTWGFTPFGARIVTRFAGLLLIPVVHILTRRLFGRRAALVASGALAVTWWPVFFSRVALRGITLPLTFTAAIYFLWRGLGLDGARETSRVKTVHWGRLALGGGLMGLTWYTFTAARGLVILLPLWLAHLALVRLISIKQLWRVALVTLGLAVLVAAPFVYEMSVHPGAPEARLDQLDDVIEELRASNLFPFVRQTANTLGLFILTGDPNWRYNVSGRPIFGLGLGGLAILGLLVSIARWRQPRYFLLLTWLLLGLAPSMLTPEAPSFVRAIGALPTAAMLAGVGAVTAWDWIKKPVFSQFLLALLLVLNGLSTFRALFITWPVQSQVREIYQAALTEAFQDLNHSGLAGPLWISVPFPDDRHLLLVRRILQRDEIEPHWFNSSRAMILPPADGVRRYLFADFAAPDPTLFTRWMSKATVILAGKAPNTEELSYQVYQAEGGPWVEQELAKIAARSPAFADLETQRVIRMPAHFEEKVALLGYELADDRLASGEEVHLVIYWRVQGPVYEPLSSFVHLLNGQNNIVGQYDGFDAPPWHWEPGAVVAQVYRFPVGWDAQPGAHWLEAGLYNPQTLERWHIVDDAGASLGDHLLLKEILVQQSDVDKSQTP